jgi:cytochrome P450
MDWPLFNISEGEAWREGRKRLDRSLRSGAIMSYRQMIQENARGFLAQLLTTPNKFRRHIKLSVASPHYIISLLTIAQPSGKTYHVSHVWLRREGG